MDSPSVKINILHTLLRTCNRCTVILCVVLYHPTSCDRTNMIVVVGPTVVWGAVLETALLSTPAFSPPPWLFPVQDCFGDRPDRAARFSSFLGYLSLESVHYELISVSNAPALGVRARSQPCYSTCCKVTEGAQVSEEQISINCRSPGTCGEG